ncbi:hypothetical protein THOM_1018 [Trachipleistophora hominis]|uniref:Uncharacterized protein n=1 Tax=Trachipleistophora hominis TaxID=72359 RepID=L7JXH4_TRAHO|nr:hypothetical protein THOM_1018 [Trachipleistophora hominis]
MRPKRNATTKRRHATTPTDPRFFAKCNVFRHLQNYAFLYPDEVNDKVKNMKRRRELEDFLVKKGKKKYFVNGGEKELWKCIRNTK